MYNSLNATGSYGLNPKDTDVGNKANIALNCVFAFSSLFAGALFNVMGHRLLLILGGLTYVLYVGSFLAYHYIESIVFVVIASCLLGLGAGWLWTAQGAVMMGYPAEGDKGKYFSIFWAIFNCGSVIGNVIPLGLQWNDPSAGGASTSAYIAYMVIMTFGALISVFLLPPEKVSHKDGTPVTRVKYSSPILELQFVARLFLDWRMLCLVPMFFTSNWFYTYQFTMNSLNFTQRTRSMNSMMYWFAQIVASLAFGAFLDRAKWTRKTRARYGLAVLTILLIATWAGGIVWQTTFGPRSYILDTDGKTPIKNPADYHMYDLVNDTGKYMGPFFLYFFYGSLDAMYQGYAYWLMGALTNDTAQAARFAGFYKFVQNLGGVLAPVVQTSTIGIAPSDGNHILHAHGHGMGEVIVAAVLVFVGVIGAIPVAFHAIKDHTVEESDEVVAEKYEADVDDVKA